VQNTLVEHWDGTTWSIVPSPNLGATYNFLRTVVAAASNDVWAVGGWGASGPVLRTLVEHWDGTTWSIVPSPNAGSSDNELLGEALVSANDIWAVGNYWDGSRARTLIEHWDGTAWTVVPSPNVSTYNNNLFSAAGRAGNDVWASGEACMAFGCGSSQALIEHWDGSSWSVMPSPATGGVRTHLVGLAARADNNVWAVGRICLVANCTMAQSLIEHWDGSVWSIVPSPDPGSVFTEYRAVVAVAPDDAWATGSYSSDGTTFGLPMVHWDGTSWTYVPVPNAGSVDNDLNSLVAISPGDIWAVGDLDSGGGERTQVQHYTGPCTTPTPTMAPSYTPTLTPTPTLQQPSPGATVTIPVEPTSTGTSSPGTVLPTDTPALPTDTPGAPTATPTSCAIEFTDVPPGSTFYPFVRCLACRGIVTGYADGTFRPGNNVTRGQAAKIIANSADYQDPIPPNRQTFNDVPVGSTFWVYIERVALHGAISGYECGGQGEPCPGRYFRPGNNLTRGQLAKIDSEAFGYNDPIPPDMQTFNDIPPSSTFWLYIERLVLHSDISGYQCGGEGEPCDPQGRAYFRWDRISTRGQTAKIISNTFFLDCRSR